MFDGVVDIPKLLALPAGLSTLAGGSGKHEGLAALEERGQAVKVESGLPEAPHSKVDVSAGGRALSAHVGNGVTNILSLLRWCGKNAREKNEASYAKRRRRAGWKKQGEAIQTCISYLPRMVQRTRSNTYRTRQAFF